jgi:hypothetical protein
MKKTEAILQFLDGCEDAQTTSDVAAGIGEADDAKNVSCLLFYLKKTGRVETVAAGTAGVESTWSITPVGREWFAELKDELGDEVAAVAARKVVAKKMREKAKAPKLQRTAAKAQPAAAVVAIDQTPLPPAVGRQIAVRDDGAILLIEDDVVITTLIPEDALRISKVIERLAA